MMNDDLSINPLRVHLERMLMAQDGVPLKANQVEHWVDEARAALDALPQPDSMIYQRALERMFGKASLDLWERVANGECDPPEPLLQSYPVSESAPDERVHESERDKARAEGFRQGLEIAAVIAEQRDPEKPSNYMHRREQIAAAILAIKY